MKNIIAASILSVGLVLAALIWIFVPPLLGTSLPGGGGGSVDDQARIDIATLQRQIEVLDSKIEQLETAILNLGSRATGPLEDSGGDGPIGTIDDYTKVVLIAERTNRNDGLSLATPSYLESVLGRPRQELSDTCEPMTNPELKAKLRLEDVGPIRVNMLAPAVESLRDVFDNVRRIDPTLYDQIQSSGTLCVRQVRGSNGRLSNHAFGLAVDLNIAGQLDNFTDGKTQIGLILMSEEFKKAGWIWGAGFRREDSMHFEVGRGLVQQWLEEGKL